MVGRIFHDSMDSHHFLETVPGLVMMLLRIMLMGVFWCVSKYLLAHLIEKHIRFIVTHSKFLVYFLATIFSRSPFCAGRA